jgi:hypothetical protein
VLEADEDVLSLPSRVGERSGVLLAGGVSTTTELEADKAATFDDALDRAGESVGIRNGVVGVRSVLGVTLLATGAGGVNGRCWDAGKGEGGGVGRLLLDEVDTVEREACPLFRGIGSGFEVA